MPSPIPVPLREAILQRWNKGESVASLADDLRLSVRTVRHLVRRFAQLGENGLIPDYTGCATKKMPTDSAIFQKAVGMRQQHPSWGGGLIRVLLQEDDDAPPSTRTLQRWFRQTTQTPAPAGRRPSSDANRARRPHEVWQMDAADQMTLASGQGVSWLRLVDECSGAVLKTTIFPPKVLEPG